MGRATDMATSDPAAQAARLATFWARADRIRQLEDELDSLRLDQVADMLEMHEMEMNNRQIAAVCGVSEQYVGRKLKREG